ncbi:hypothetical protein KDI_56240 [Dictyobacter arantiisoli]|uniref:Uncharacterized protein n=1 Tax=Dictyobacter arantiisoli TaxID=2014874 RepID=A0A5A5TKA7_9CHLR|nr:hypothetical protein KDI_56240 [Dictyobacter arantiisoli]
MVDSICSFFSLRGPELRSPFSSRSYLLCGYADLSLTQSLLGKYYEWFQLGIQVTV